MRACVLACRVSQCRSPRFPYSCVCVFFCLFYYFVPLLSFCKVTEEIRQGTKCHFDYMALLVASSAISAMGLATDNVAVVVAAMLVSVVRCSAARCGVCCFGCGLVELCLVGEWVSGRAGVAPLDGFGACCTRFFHIFFRNFVLYKHTQNAGAKPNPPRLVCFPRHICNVLNVEC